MNAPRLPRGLYGMLDLSSGDPNPRHVYAPLFRAGVGILQLRMKDAGAAAMLAVLDEISANRPAGTLLVVNDRLDVALAGRADGVHLGQDDLPLPAARRACPPGFLIGISTHNEAQFQAALEGGADYVALGPIYETRSKKNPDPVVGVQRLAALCARARAAGVPVVAIGGITLARLPEVAAAGVQAAAIIAAVNQAPDVEAAARQAMAAFG